MKKFFLCLVPALCIAVFVASCASMSSGPEPVVPLKKKDLEALAAQAKQPQLFGVVVYPSDSGPVFGGVTRTHEGEVASVSFPAMDQSRAAIVPVGIGGSETHNALLDSSAPQSWATLAMKRALRIELLAAPSLLASKPTHVFDTYGGLLGVAGRLKVGEDMSVENVLLNVRGASGAIGPLARGHDNANIQVVLGVDFLKGFNHVSFNFPMRHVVLSSSIDCKISESNLLATVPMILSNGTIAVEAVMDGAVTNILLDTGGNYAVALPVGQTAGRRKQVSIGDLVLRDLPAHPGMDLTLGKTSEPRLGRLALARFKVTMDFRERVVHFEKP